MNASAASAGRLRRPERTLLRPTLIGLMRLKWISQMSPAETEVPWYGKRVDLAVLPVRDAEWPMAIELKVGNTRRAIEQAALNRYLSPSSWVATLSQPSSPLLSLADAEGVGVLLIADPGIYPLMQPRGGEAHTNALRKTLLERGTRVRDILSELRRHG